MKMLKYLIPLLLVSVTCTSAFSLSSLFNSATEQKAEESPAVDAAEDLVEEENVDESEEDEEASDAKKAFIKDTVVSRVLLDSLNAVRDKIGDELDDDE